VTSSVEGDPPTQPLGVWRTRLAILAVGSGLLVQFIDSTALSTALPTLAQAFGTDPVHLKLTLTCYMLIQAAVVPASGWAADRFGARRVFVAALFVFMTGSILCGLSRSLGTLVLFRIVQGAGAAMCVPVGRMIVVGATPRENLVKSMILLTTPAMIGPLLGPPLTGFILEFADWPWIFYINVPICLLGMAAVAAFVPKVVQPSPGRFDYLGFLYAGAAILASTAVLETLGFDLVPWQAQVGVAILGAAATIAFLRHARRHPRPILDLSLLAIPSFRASLVGGVFVRIAFGAQPFLVPLLLQVALGWSALKAGSVMVAGAVGSLCIRLAAPTIIRLLGFRSTLIFATCGYAVVLLVPPFLRPSTPTAAIVVLLLVQGMLGATMFTALNTVAYAETDNAVVNRASTLYAVVQQVSLSLGVTAGALLLQLARLAVGDELTPRRFLLPFCVLALSLLCGLPFFRRLSPDTGADMRGRPRRTPIRVQ
jgi:EmrB/QacA subfamily drug resistance transporter